MLSIKDLVFKEKTTKKLMERYIELYTIEEIILANVIKLKLLVSIRIYLVVNISKIMRYRKLGKRAKSRESETSRSSKVEE